MSNNQTKRATFAENVVDGSNTERQHRRRNSNSQEHARVSLNDGAAFKFNKSRRQSYIGGNL